MSVCVEERCIQIHNSDFVSHDAHLSISVQLMQLFDEINITFMLIIIIIIISRHRRVNQSILDSPALRSLRNI